MSDETRWWHRAACRGVDPDIRRHFHTTAEGEGDPGWYAPAYAVCGRCPVADECLEDGLSERWHVWGGLAVGQRRRVIWLRRRGRWVEADEAVAEFRRRNARLARRGWRPRRRGEAVVA
ncbi:MAG: WhiB family transcriptional regulator [Actinomyces sp.]|nr:MAG: WhiB family transcriptional regulator [Actinomyces sp.]